MWAILLSPQGTFLILPKLEPASRSSSTLSVSFLKHTFFVHRCRFWPSFSDVQNMHINNMKRCQGEDLLIGSHLSVCFFFIAAGSHSCYSVTFLNTCFASDSALKASQRQTIVSLWSSNKGTPLLVDVTRMQVKLIPCGQRDVTFSWVPRRRSKWARESWLSSLPFQVRRYWVSLKIRTVLFDGALKVLLFWMEKDEIKHRCHLHVVALC